MRRKTKLVIIFLSLVLAFCFFVIFTSSLTGFSIFDSSKIVMIYITGNRIIMFGDSVCVDDFGFPEYLKETTGYGATCDYGETDDPLTDDVSYSGDVYYIDCEGDDSWSGKAPSWNGTDGPWKSVNSLILKNKTTTLGSCDWGMPHFALQVAPSNSAFLFKRGCSFEGYIRYHPCVSPTNQKETFTFGAYGERTAPRPIINYTFPSSIPSRGVFWSNKHAFNLRNLHLIETNLSNNGPVVSLVGTNDSSIVNCEIEQTNLDGITVDDSNNFLFLNNFVFNTSITARGGGIAGGGSNFKIINSSFVDNGLSGLFAHNVYLRDLNGTIVEGNFFSGTAGGGLTVHGLSYNVIIRKNDFYRNNLGIAIGAGYDTAEEFVNFTIEQNKIHDSKSQKIGMYLDSLINSTIKNNLVWNCSGEGLILFRSSNLSDANLTNIQIYNNNFYNSPSSIKGFFSKNISVKNNIFYTNSSDDFPLSVQLSMDLTELELDNNLYYSPSRSDDKILARYNDTTWAFNVSYNLSQLSSVLGKEIQGINANPLFTDITNNNFTLQSSSPAIDNGTNVLVYEDFDGNSRPINLKWDIGAYEYQDEENEVTCFDGIQNGDETGIDCGGSCVACEYVQSCQDIDNDGILDYNETICVDGKDVCPWTNKSYFNAENRNQYLPDYGELNETITGNIEDASFQIENNFSTLKFNQNLLLVRINETGCFERLNFSSLNFIKIEDKKIFVNSSFFKEMNKSATLIFKNVSFITPKLLKDGLTCQDCILNYYNSTSLVASFNVSGFSEYSVVEGFTNSENPSEDDSGSNTGGGGGSTSNNLDSMNLNPIEINSNGDNFIGKDVNSNINSSVGKDVNSNVNKNGNGSLEGENAKKFYFILIIVLVLMIIVVILILIKLIRNHRGKKMEIDVRGN